MARAGLAEQPAVSPPKALVPILRFRRPLPAPALASVRRVLDDDEAFRERVSAAGDETTVGAAGRLLLARPDGWLEALADLEVAATAAARAEADAAEERSARRRLRAVEDRARTAEERVAALENEVAGLRGELAIARRAEIEAEQGRAALEARLRGLEKERDAAHRKAAALGVEVARLEAGRSTAPVPVPVPDPGPAVPVAALRKAVEEATAAAATLGEALDAAAAALGAAEGAPTATGDQAPTPRVRARLPATARLPVPLPPAMFDDGAAAAGHLVRQPGCVLVVDGYNASIRRWPDLPIAEQRHRLVDALGGLAARSGAQVQVVFDGADEGGRTGGDGRRGVRVTFSAGGIEADQVIVELVDRMPPPVPVVVATDDRWVRRESAARGANVVSQEQLFSLL